MSRFSITDAINNSTFIIETNVDDLISELIKAAKQCGFNATNIDCIVNDKPSYTFECKIPDSNNYMLGEIFQCKWNLSPSDSFTCLQEFLDNFCPENSGIDGKTYIIASSAFLLCCILFYIGYCCAHKYKLPKAMETNSTSNYPNFLIQIWSAVSNMCSRKRSSYQQIESQEQSNSNCLGYFSQTFSKISDWWHRKTPPQQKGAQESTELAEDIKNKATYGNFDFNP